MEDNVEDYIKDFLKLTKYPSFTLMHNNNNIEYIVGPYLDKVKNLLESMTGSDDF